MTLNVGPFQRKNAITRLKAISRNFTGDQSIFTQAEDVQNSILKTCRDLEQADILSAMDRSDELCKIATLEGYVIDGVSISLSSN